MHVCLLLCPSTFQTKQKRTNQKSRNNWEWQHKTQILKRKTFFSYLFLRICLQKACNLNNTLKIFLNARKKLAGWAFGLALTIPMATHRVNAWVQLPARLLAPASQWSSWREAAMTVPVTQVSSLLLSCLRSGPVLAIAGIEEWSCSKNAFFLHLSLSFSTSETRK